MPRVTIYSVAQACGVSSSTVSRAFTRPDLVKDSVRQRVLAAAADLGYRPNKSARAIATGKTAMVGLVVPDITNPFMPPLVRAVQRCAHDHDWSVILVDAAERATAESDLIKQLDGQVDGLILASPRGRASALLAAAVDLPVVLMNRVIRGLSSVVCDNGAALAAIGDDLVRHGHRRVALLDGPPGSWAARQRRRAIRTWANRAGVAVRELGPFEASFEGGRHAGAALPDSNTTAAFAFDDVMACGVLAELAAQGLEVPRQYSVVGCDDVLLARMVTPSLTTVAAPFSDLGRIAVELLLERVSDPTAKPRRVILPGSHVVRDSTGHAPASPRVR